MEISRRPMTPEERGQVSARLDAIGRARPGLRGLLVVAVIAVLVLLAAGPGGLLLVGPAALLVFMIVRTRRRIAALFAGQAEQARRDLDLGELEVARYQVRDAVRVEEVEDEGPGYFLDVGDGQLLFLQDQGFYLLEDEKRFPCRELTVTRTIHSHAIFEVDYAGDCFPPSRTRLPLDETPPVGVPFSGSLADV